MLMPNNDDSFSYKIYYYLTMLAYIDAGFPLPVFNTIPIVLHFISIEEHFVSHMWHQGNKLHKITTSNNFELHSTDLDTLFWEILDTFVGGALFWLSFLVLFPSYRLLLCRQDCIYEWSCAKTWVSSGLDSYRWKWLYWTWIQWCIHSSRKWGNAEFLLSVNSGAWIINNHVLGMSISI